MADEQEDAGALDRLDRAEPVREPVGERLLDEHVPPRAAAATAISACVWFGVTTKTASTSESSSSASSEPAARQPNVSAASERALIPRETCDEVDTAGAFRGRSHPATPHADSHQSDPNGRRRCHHRLEGDLVERLGSTIGDDRQRPQLEPHALVGRDGVRLDHDRHVRLEPPTLRRRRRVVPRPVPAARAVDHGRMDVDAVAVDQVIVDVVAALADHRPRADHVGLGRPWSDRVGHRVVRLARGVEHPLPRLGWLGADEDRPMDLPE